MRNENKKTAAPCKRNNFYVIPIFSLSYLPTYQNCQNCETRRARRIARNKKPVSIITKIVLQHRLNGRKFHNEWVILTFEQPAMEVPIPSTCHACCQPYSLICSVPCYSLFTKIAFNLTKKAHLLWIHKFYTFFLLIAHSRSNAGKLIRTCH